MTKSQKTTKSAIVRNLLAREEGASIETLGAATGWQAHSVRAVLSTLRKAGVAVEKLPKSETESTVRYRLRVEAGDRQ